MNDRPHALWFYLGVFVVSLSTLMLQIIQTRILSVMTFYYFAFLSIGMAMFGLTAGALLVYFDRLGFGNRSFSENLTWACQAFALSITVCFAIQLTAVTINFYAATVVLLWLKLVLLLAMPFVFAGAAISLALTRSPFPIDIVYGVDLLGAASGCLSVIVVLSVMHAPSAMFLVAAIAALAAVCFAQASPRTRDRPTVARRAVPWRRPALVAVALVCVSVVNTLTPYGFQPVGGKFGTEARREFDLEKWNSFSRVVALKSHADAPFLWGTSPTYRVERLIEQRELNIDGFASTTMPHFDGDVTSVSFLANDITNLAYAIRNTGRCAVIGVGSGRDLLSAWVFGCRDVTGIEVNPIFVDFLQNPNRFRAYAGIADLPGVHLVVDEGRSWLRRTQQRFDIVQMSMLDTFAATGAGAFSLSENGLYTVEGWRVFLNALTPSGVLTVSRWYAPEAPVEMGRVVSLASAALLSVHADNPQKHIFIAGTNRLATIIVGRSPLREKDVAYLTATSDRLKFSILATPDQPSNIPALADLLRAQSLTELDRRGRRYPLDVTAPTDARPFFFNQLRIDHPGDVVLSLREARRSGSLVAGRYLILGGNVMAILTLLLLILLSAGLVLVVIVWPTRASTHHVPRMIVRAGTAYFFLIGLGFMLIEIAFCQRMSIFLGHPIYGLSVVLFSIILSTGLGSFLSGIGALKRQRDLAIWLALLVVYVILLPVWLPAILAATEASGILIRAVVSVGLVTPAGLLMGYAFPTGMRMVEALDRRATPWFWGVNGAAGVLASGLAVLVSIAFSIDWTLRLGSVCYLLLLQPAHVLLKLETLGSLRARNLVAHHAGHTSR